MPVVTKSEQVYRELKHRITSLGPSMPIPSVREMMREYGISQVTVERALRMLAQEGLIAKAPSGRRHIVCKGGSKSHVCVKTVGLAFPDYPSPIYEILISFLSRKVQDAGMAYRLIRYDWQERILRRLPRETVDGLIIMPVSTMLEPEDLIRVKEFGVPIVHLYHVMRGISQDYVSPDEEMGGAIIANHLIHLGHRRLTILIAEPRSVIMDERVAGFMKQARLSGIEDVQVLDCQTQSGESSIEKAYATVRRKVRAGLDFTGLFVVSDHGALGAMKALHDEGIRIPQDVSVVGFDGLSESAYYHPALTTKKADFEELADAAVTVIHRRLQGETQDAIQIMLTPSLRVLESTGPVRK